MAAVNDTDAGTSTETAAAPTVAISDTESASSSDTHTIVRGVLLIAELSYSYTLSAYLDVESPASSPPSGVVVQDINRVSPVMPDPTLVDGRPT